MWRVTQGSGRQDTVCGADAQESRFKSYLGNVDWDTLIYAYLHIFVEVFWTY